MNSRQATAGVEKQWIQDARKRGLKNAEQVLREFRADIARLQ
ncbi:MAG: hypothetical protein R3E48_03155 [Burkholderiaceae bacterium]